MYGDQDYYPGDDYLDHGTSDDFHTYGQYPAKAPEKRNPHKRIRSFGEHTPVGRNDNFSTGAAQDAGRHEEPWPTHDKAPYNPNRSYPEHLLRGVPMTRLDLTSKPIKD